MKKGQRLIIAVLALSACGKPGREAKTDMTLYLEPGKSFSCQAPAQWKVLENQGGAQRVTFLGPAGVFSDSISVYYYPKSGAAFSTPQEYAKGQALLPGKSTPLVFKPWKGLAVYEFSATRRRPALHGAGELVTRRESTVLIPAPEGFYALVYSAPEARFAQGEPVFRELIDSLNFGATGGGR